MKSKVCLVGLVSALLISVFLGSAVALAQSPVVTAEDVLFAASFDAKYLLPEYIAYSGSRAIAERGLAVYYAGEFDRHLILAGGIAQVQPVDLMAQEMLSQAELQARIVEAECYDRNFHAEGHLICHDSANVVESEADPS
jgi:hypothetical protein